MQAEQMLEILERQTLILKNVLSHRFCVPYHMVNHQTQEIEKFLKKITKGGFGTTAIYAIEERDGMRIIDMEVKIPLSKPIKPPKEYNFSAEYRLENALKITHIGTPQLLEKIAMQLIEYIKENDLTPKSPMYNVVRNEAQTQEDMESIIIDMYVGV